MADDQPLESRRWRAPRESGEKLIDPSRDQIGRLLAGNLKLQHPLAAEARRDLVAAATTYTWRYRDVDVPAGSDAPLIMAGHQPELYHPGVWFKNFLLSSLGQHHSAIAVNLIADGDVVDTPAIRVPAGTRAVPLLESVAIDAPSPGVPHEERAIVDHSLFDSFDRRVMAAEASWIDRPLVKELWRHAREAYQATNNLGRVLAQARHALEGEWGLRTLEIPASIVFSQPSFHRFLQRLIDDAASFREIHNAALHEFRTINRVRSRSHPVPDLAMDDDWCELPLWIWSQDAPQRRRLFVRSVANGWELTDRGSIQVQLPSRTVDALTAWETFQQRGIKIRPRAIVTTMFARLVLSDLFIHGIGGAKYDELTDAIIRRFFGVEPPAYVTATATVHLPLHYPMTPASAVEQIQHELREVPFHAEKYLSSAVANDLVEQKKTLLREIPPRGQKRQWHRELTRLNECLTAQAEDQRREMTEKARRLAEEYRISRMLGSREFSFCLFPAEFLRQILSE